MTPEQLEQIETRANAATAGGSGEVLELLAHAQQDIPALCAALRQLQSDYARLEGKYAALLKMDAESERARTASRVARDVLRS